MASQKNNNGLTSKLIPNIYQSDANKKFLQATLDQLVQPGTIKKVNGYAGRKNAKASVGDDIYINAAGTTRQNYQLEPGFTVQDELGNYTFFKDYQDYINDLYVLGSNTKNHSRLNKQEFYSWNPHIDWDKFSNFQQYYWLPYGPDTITVFGQQSAIQSTIKVSIENEGTNFQWMFSSDALVPNPTIKLYRGQTYVFEIDSIGNPFTIATVRSNDVEYLYQTPGLDGNKVFQGTITFTVPADAPSLLYYFSDTDLDASGVFEILSIEENTYLDVEKDLLGKTSYTLPNGVTLSNGMKIKFIGNITPETYSKGQYYVEGVGTGIVLTEESSLEIIAPYTTDTTILFDSDLFDSLPFSSASSYAGTLDYITINRSSQDKNPWSRYNRWFHKDVIEVSAALNGNVPSLDQTARAVRPIIEFESNLQLYNFGNKSVVDVDVIDNFTTDAFSIIEGSLGYNIDGVDLVQGYLVIFTADPDPFVKDNVYEVQFVSVNGVQQIHLALHSTPSENDSVIVKSGIKNQSITYWYNGTDWIYAQQKTKANQQPLFDIFNSDGISFSDTTIYTGSTFKGSAVFSYAVGSSSNDPSLGFPLLYKNINNIGDIVFNFNLVSDTFVYKLSGDIVTVDISIGYLKQIQTTASVFVNGWITNSVTMTQGAVRIYKNSEITNNFDIDIFDNINDLDDLVVKVYVNGIRLESTEWSISDGVIYKYVELLTDVTTADVLTIKAYAAQPINKNGFYEIPLNLQNNPLNNEITTFTLGEVLDHVESIVENVPNFSGSYPGFGNLRDLGQISKYGTKFVQHSGPASLSLYHITNKTNNVIRAIEKSRNDYVAFKRAFINAATGLSEDLSVVESVDYILRKINENKPKTGPYYFSDMVPYGAAIVSDIPVLDYRIKTYPLTDPFSLDVLSYKSVLIYRNGTQLLYNTDYIFDSDNSNFIMLDTSPLANGDVLTTYEYDSTNGSFVPETPTKLGFWPAYEPKILLDNTLLTPRELIQGHDGSLTLTYGDYRDDLLLELEKRIFNNIKISYNTEIFDVYDFIPGYNRTTDYSLSEFNSTLSPYFYEWIGLTNSDFTTPFSFDTSNSFTYNYAGHYAPNGEATPGFWRGIYRWMFDTDHPNETPWEMLGFTSEPTWWTSVYGPAPYTSNNLILWNDLSEGIVRAPGSTTSVRTKFIRPILKTNIPVDENGELLSPYSAGLALGTITDATSGSYVFGDISPVETAWRRSSYYPYTVLLASTLLQPSKTIGIFLDRSRVTRNPAGQLVYADTMLRIQPSTLALSSVYSSSVNVQTAGLINFIVNYVLDDTLESYAAYKTDLTNINCQLSYRLGAFTSKEKFDIILDSRTPLSASNSVFVPKENYNLHLNKSSPINRIIYSGVIITRLADGFVINGYSKVQPYFNYYSYYDTGIVVNIGGISESYVNWTAGESYYPGQVVQYNRQFYRTISSQILVTSFDPTGYVLLKSLPINGGVNSNFRSKWNRKESLVLPYGTKLEKIQDVVDFLLGHGEYLKDQGFIFEDFNPNLPDICNWETSAKEFLFWTTQNWSSVQDKWTEWTPNIDIEYNEIVRYNGEYYQALQKIPATSSVPVNNLSVSGEEGDYRLYADDVLGVYIGMLVTGPGVEAGALVQSVTGHGPYVINLTENNIGTVTQASFVGFFNTNLYENLPGLDTVGSAVISLSPAAGQITFLADLAVVESVTDPFNSYSIFKVDGTPISPQFIDSYRNGNVVSYRANNNDGIYAATFYLIQQEQILLLDNVTMFNDTIYNPETGYRQERIKISGYVSSEWYGGFDVPGFIVDQAIVKNWEAWQDYALGDTVLYQQYYYSANRFVPGVDVFKIAEPDGVINWIKLSSAPASKLIPNWSYKATQFTDFYSLDSDNFDADQQSLAQHLIGYQKRQYLENLIQDSVGEFKFYQGMIYDKGTQNAFNKLFGVLNSENADSLQFYEEWAIRVGQYGSAEGFEEIEFVLDEEEFNKRNPQGFELVSRLDEEHSDFVNRLSPNEIYLKPLNYSSNPWPTISNYRPYLRSAGYVRPGEVSASIASIDNIIDIDIATLVDGDYIWCGFEGPSWNVYRFTNTKNKVTELTYSSNKLNITFSHNHELRAGDYVGIRESGGFDGFYKITDMNPVTIIISTTLTTAPLVPYEGLNDIVIFRFNSQRASSIDTANSSIPQEIKSGELLWTDDNGSGIWSTWQNDTVYADSEIKFSLPKAGLGFGREIAITSDGSLAAISTKTGQTFIYHKSSPSSSWIQRDTIDAPEISKSDVFGNNSNEFVQLAEVLAMSPDGAWLAIGSPTASNAATIQKTYYKAVDILAGTNSGLAGQGAVSLYKKDANNIFTLVDTILSPSPTAGELFGSSLVFKQTTQSNNFVSYNLLVGAKGFNSGIGRVYEIKYQQLVQATASYNPNGSSNNGIVGINVDSPGSGFLTNPIVIIAAPTDSGGVQATATCTIGVASARLIQAGSGYLVGDLLTVTGGSSTQPAILRVTAINTNIQKGNIGAVLGVSIVNAGKYTVAPTLTNIVTGGTGTNVRFAIEVGISSFTVTNPGGGYIEKPFVSFSGTGSGAVATTVLGSVVTLSSTSGIAPGMSITGTGFTNNQTVTSVVNSTAIVISSAASSIPSGNLNFSIVQWNYNTSSYISAPNGQKAFGSSLSSAVLGNVLAVGAIGVPFDGTYNSEVVGRVNLYQNNGTAWTLIQSPIVGGEYGFSKGLSVSEDGIWVAIGSPYKLKKYSNQGQVDLYYNDTGTFNFYQEVENINPQVNGLFGAGVAWMNGSNTMVVYSQNSDIETLEIFDSGNTIFDGNSTKFKSIVRNNGRIDVYDRYNLNFIYGETLRDLAELNSEYGDGFAVGSNNILIGAPSATVNNLIAGRVFGYGKKSNAYSWTILHHEIPKVNLTKFKRALIYDKTNSSLVSYIDIIDPMQGKIPGPAEQEIRYKSFYDPAIYSIGNATVNVSEGQAWTDAQVGQLWWDLRTAKFIDAHDNDVVYRNNSWALLFPGASIDIYEWVSSSYTPSQWNKLADTVSGLSQNISGQSLYDDTVYSSTQSYNNVSKTYKTTYYFWVKNKTIVPNLKNRSLSASDAANLIGNPRGAGYKFLALTGSNSFSLANVKPLLNDKNMVLSVEYWTIDNPEHALVHRQYAIINNDKNTVLPELIEQKWFDSLCGKDQNGRVVPDVKLPPKLKYGIEFRPRQGMFVNRSEALKQFIEEVNRTLISYQITTNKNISALDLYELPPSDLTGLYDIVKDTDYDLRFVNVGNFSLPSLVAVITEGRITGVTIVSAGSGYINAPYITVSGDGEGAILKAQINAFGQLIGVTIVDPGQGYNEENTMLGIRSYSVLVHSDSGSQGYWSIYTFDLTTRVWSRIQTQSYDVRPYWSYADWYDTNYNQYTVVDYSVNTFTGLYGINSKIGELVKVKTTNNGTWMILEKYAESESIDWTQRYKPIAVEKGTIQFNSILYNLTDTVYGYDGALYDDLNFDNSANQELRIILDAIKNDILIDDLRQAYLNLFFSSVRYAISEQTSVDWIFKTSFIKADHLVGPLKQPVNYQPDNLSDFESYISEVKPYRTKIREYVDNYSNLDLGSTAVTDFDLPPQYQSGAIVPILTGYSNDNVTVDNAIIDSVYPWAFWNDNHSYKVIELRIVDAGSGYITAPEVIIESGSGAGATAKTFITNGSIRTVVLLTSGSGYLSAPTVVLNGGVTDGGRKARIIAVIGDGVVRKTTVGVKFDRLSKTYSLIELEKIETITASASKLQYTLPWAPDIRLGTHSVTVNGIPVISDDYALSVKTSNSLGYTSYSGLITFDNSFTAGSVIKVSYLINWSLLHASDRVQYYYTPETGQPGKELAQLMSGVDYGGVIVNSFGFETNYGWDSSSLFSDVWDGTDSSFTDYITVVDADTHTFNLPYLPATGTNLNIYYSEYFSETYAGDGVQTQFTFDIRQQTPVASVSCSSNILLPYSATFQGLGIAITNVIGSGSSIVVSFATRSEIPFSLNQIISISNIATTVNSLQSYSHYNGIYTVTFATNHSITLIGTDTAQYASGGTISLVNETLVALDSTMDLDAGMKLIRTNAGYNTVIGEIKTVINSTLVTLVQSLESKSVAVLTTSSVSAGATVLSFRSTSSLISGSTVVGGPIGILDNVTMTILSGTQITLSSSLTSAVDAGTSFTFTYTPIPDTGETVLITYNAKGSNKLQLDSIDNIQLKDKVSLVGTDLTLFAYSTTVSTILNNNILELDHVLYDTVVSAETVLFERTLTINPKTSVAGVGVVTLLDPINTGETLTISSNLAPVRIDDENYGTLNQTNADAVMLTVVADGESRQVDIPGTFVVNDFDKFIIRQSTSDGSIEPLTSSFDTKIDGGNMAYTSASGLLADDITIDGDGFVTPMTSYFPEEVVPGQVVDALAIKVFDKPSGGSAEILVQKYLADGETFEFNIGQIPNSSSAVIVKTTVADVTTILTETTDYIVDYKNQTIVFVNLPDIDTLVSIYSIGFSGTDILVFDYFVGDGHTKEFVTQAKWISSFTSGTYVDGNSVDNLTFETDDTYDSAHRIGFRLVDAPAVGSIIAYIFVAGATQTFAITSKQIIPTDGTLTYALDNIVGDALPNETTMIVRVDQTILPRPKNSYFTIANNQLVYTVDPGLFTPYKVRSEDVAVIVGGVILKNSVDYLLDVAGIQITLYETTYLKYVDQAMIISIKTQAGYFYIPPANRFTPPYIQFSHPYDNTSTVEIISSYRNNVLGMATKDLNVNPKLALVPDTQEYFEYQNIFGGIIKLDDAVRNENYVWVTKNGKLLTPSLDYILNSDFRTLKLAVSPNTADNITILTFSSNIITSGISYMQFKDMLNRTSYTRLSLNKRTQLASDLRATDKIITVVDASNFDIPNPAANKPGIVEIRGERIEYFTLDGNVLGQLRRGVLGTGVSKIHKSGSYVQDIGTAETIPYTDTTNTQQIVSTGSNTITTNVKPIKSSSIWSYQTGFTSVIPTGFGQSNDIEVFVGGYDISIWSETTSYVINDIVSYNGYDYKCTTDHISSSSFAKDKTNWKFFISNIRLQKQPYEVYNVNQAPNSPAGDVQFDADFSVDGVNNSIRLTTALKENVVVTVVQRKGKDWDSTVNIIDDTGQIAEFLKATPGAWYTGIENYSLSVNTNATFDNSDITFDNSHNTFDQGS
jgi:hypothetical protein